MSTQSDANSSDATPTDSSKSEGVHEDSEGVIWEIHRTGWASPIGHAIFRRERRNTSLEAGPLVWERWNSNVVALSQPASLILLQGLSPAKLFDEDCLLKRRNGDQEVKGPFYYLQGQPFDPWMVPQHILNVVLGKPIVGPPNVKLEDVLSALVRERS